MRFRKLPVVIEAVQWDGGNFDRIWDFTEGAAGYHDKETGRLYVETSEGTMTANLGDWIIKGIASEFYPCKREIFNETYEPA